MCDKGCGLVFTTEFGLLQMAGQFTFVWQVFLRKSHMRVKILNDRLLIFCFAAITLFLPPCPMCTFPLSFLYKATQAHTHTHRTWRKNLPPLLLCILSLCCSGRGFGWSALIAMGLSLSPVLWSKKKKTESSHSSNQHLPDSSPRELPQVFFLVFFLLFSSWQITVMSQTVRREQWSAFCLPFPIANWILCNPSEHACTVEVSHHRWTSTTDTIATTGKKPWNCSLTPYTPTTTLFHSLLSPQLRHVGLPLEKREGCHLFFLKFLLWKAGHF